MEKNSKFKKFLDVKEDFFYIETSTIKEDIKYIIKNNITNIALNKYKGFINEDLSVLSELYHIRKLSLAPCDVKNASTILPYFTNLEYLNIGIDNVIVDFSNLKKLKYLYFDYHKNTMGLKNLTNLEVLHVYKANKFFFTEDLFQSFKKLRRLEIVQSKDLDNLSCFSKLLKIKELEFQYCRTLIDISFITQHLKNTLEFFKIGNCKNIINHNLIVELKKLKWLALVDSIILDDVNFVKQFPDLEVLIVLGKSYFKDGDLSILKEKKLRHVGIDNKRHYNIKYEDLKK